MTGVEIKSLWLEDALRDEHLKRAVCRLQLKDGDFAYHVACASRRKIRMFFAEGPRGGVRGILLAHRRHQRMRVGVYVDRKSRRAGLATMLLGAARLHYPESPLEGVIWNGASHEFWTKVRPITRHEGYQREAGSRF